MKASGTRIQMRLARARLDLSVIQGGLSVVCHPLPPVGQCLSLIGSALTLVGDPIALSGFSIPFAGTQGTLLLRSCAMSIARTRLRRLESRIPCQGNSLPRVESPSLVQLGRSATASIEIRASGIGKALTTGAERAGGGAGKACE